MLKAGGNSVGKEPLYEVVVGRISSLIEQGALRPGGEESIFSD